MSSRDRLDFNADLGEGGDDAALLPYLSSASIACGLHAGDPLRMRESVVLCQQHGVAIGAHPSLDDREGFGRRELAVTPAQVYALVQCQVAALAGIADAVGARLVHVKPHGALYNMAAREPALADVIAGAVRDFNPGLRLVGLAGSELTAAGTRHGLAVAHEVFAERRYEADGRLTPRDQPGAVIESLEVALAQVRGLVREGVVVARSGERVALCADTLCLHGDRPDAAAFARALYAALRAEGIAICALEADR